jgi:hypothetical protein
MLQLDVPELVKGASLPKNATLVRVVEKRHQPERQMTVQCQPTPSYQPLRPR